MLDLNITMLFQLANFLITLFVLNRLLIRPVRGIIAERKALMANLTGEAESFESKAQSRLDNYEAELTKARQKAAETFAAAMRDALLDLNFLRVAFEIRVEPDRAHPGPEGWDRVSMYISMNPGEPLRPLLPALPRHLGAGWRAWLRGARGSVLSCRGRGSRPPDRGEGAP